MPDSDAARHAREQATAYKSAFAPTPMTLHYEDGTTEVIEIPPPPQLRMLDDDPLSDYEDLLFEAETKYDREPDRVIPEQRLESGIVLPEETRRGVLKTPYRITDEEGKTQLVKPPWSIAVVEAALGKKNYGKLKSATKTTWLGGEGNGSAADAWRIWNEQTLEMAKRQDADTFPVQGDSSVAPVSRGNS